jgi:transposase-like protein
MAESQTAVILKAKRAEIAAAIENYEHELERARADFAHISAALAIFDAGDGPGSQRPYVKPANVKEYRRDRRMLANQSGKRQSVIVARERDGNTITFAAKSEAAAVPMLHERIAAGSTVYADEASHWDAFHASYKTKRINHSEAYSTSEGCTNMAESFFSRLRRAEVGTHHHIAGPYLAAYAAEMDWREDNRRLANGDQYRAIVAAAAAHPVSRTWKGYWQRRA